MLRGCWFNIIVLNVHAPTQDKIDDTVAHLLKARTVEPEQQQLLVKVRTEQ
jgi:hypothetical protein